MEWHQHNTIEITEPEQTEHQDDAGDSRLELRSDLGEIMMADNFSQDYIKGEKCKAALKLYIKNQKTNCFSEKKKFLS